MSAIIINSVDSLQRAFGDLRDLWNSHKFLRVNVKTGKDRSLDYNALSHVWYAQIARELKDDDDSGWKSFCKLHFAVPILRTEDEEFRNFYDLAIKGLTYGQKLQAMKYMPVTSLMTNPQFKKYCDEMQAHFLNRGVYLEFLDDKCF